MIIGFIKQAEAGLPIKELTHLHSAEPQQSVQRLGEAMVHATREPASATRILLAGMRLA